MTILWGLFWIGIGFLMIRYTFVLVQTFGKINWAETHMSGGLGGTYTLYKLIGVLIIFLAFMYMFGLIDKLVGPIAPYFSGPK